MAVWGAPIAREDDAGAGRPRGPRARGRRPRPRAGGPGSRRRPERRGRRHARRARPGHGRRRPGQHRVAPAVGGRARHGPRRRGDPPRRGRARSRSRTPASTVLKGKDAPVAAWRALRVVAERHGRGRSDRLEAPFVGRDTELRLLKDLFHATSREHRARLVSITGQAGIGKSRLDLGAREVPRRPGRGRLVARRPLARLRRGHHVLGARRDGPRPLRAARDRRPGHDARQGRRHARASTCPTRPSGAGSSRALLALLGVGRAAGRRSRRALPRVADVLRAARRRRASSSSPSRTCTGPTPACSTSSTTCSSGAAASRS